MSYLPRPPTYPLYPLETGSLAIPAYNWFDLFVNSFWIVEQLKTLLIAIHKYGLASGLAKGPRP